MKQPEVAIRPLDGEVVIVLHGDVSVGAADALHEKVRPMTGRYDADQMTFDCSAVTSIDLVALEALLRIGRIPRGSGRLTLVDPSGVVASALGSDASELFDIVDDDLQGASGGN